MELNASIRLTFLLLLGLSLQSNFVSCQTDHDDDSIDYSDNHAKVLILGAGATGIKAAQVFHDNGMDDFLIIEGADYIGGRVKHEKFANVTINIGANWVTPSNTPMIDLVLNEFGLETYPMDWDDVILRGGDGHEFTDEEADPVWDRFDEAYFNKSYDVAVDIRDKGKHDISIRAGLRIGGWVAKTPLEKAVEWYTSDFETGERSDVTSLSSLIFIDFEETFFVIDELGYNGIFDKLAPFLKTPKFSDHVRLNQRITKIDYDEVDGLVKVHSEDGTIYTGERALVTFSLGVLQSDLVEFNPKLPDWKIEELYQMHMSSYALIFIKFPEKFWDDEMHLLHVNDRYNYYPYFMNFDALGSYLSDDNHILVGHVMGNEAWRIHYQSDEETKEEVETVLQGMFKLDSPPRASEIRVVTDWLENPLTMGAYSNWPVEISQECFLKLQARVGPLFFGGEHTDELYNGYVYGGIRSGEREAKKMLSCMSGNECPEYEPPSYDDKDKKERKERKCYEPPSRGDKKRKNKSK